MLLLLHTDYSEKNREHILHQQLRGKKMNLTQKIVSLLAAGIIVSPLAAEAKKPSALQRVMNEDVGALLGSRLPGEYS